jgi:hypothetical protein
MLKEIEVVGGTLQTAAAIQEQRAAADAGGTVRREYPARSAGRDPAVLAIAAELVEASKPVAPANQLGRLAGGSAGPGSAIVELRALIRRHFGIVVEPSELSALHLLASDTERERALVEYHSGALTQQRADTAMRLYAQNPTVANLKAVREAKSFAPHEAGLIQQHAGLRLRKALQERLPQIAIPILERTVKLIESSIDKLASEDVARYGEYDLSPSPSLLQTDLERLLGGLKGELVGYRNGNSPDGGMCGLPLLVFEVAAETEAK